MPLASPDVANIIIGGPASVSVSPYVAVRGAGTFVPVGYTIGGVAISFKRDRHKIVSDQLLGNLISEPMTAEAKIKFKMLEGRLLHLQQAMGQPGANLTGTDPDMILGVNFSERSIPHQIQVIGRGNGATGVRTLLAWNCVFEEIEDYEIKKDGPQIIGVTIDILEETDSGSTDSFEWTDT